MMVACALLYVQYVRRVQHDLGPGLVMMNFQVLVGQYSDSSMIFNSYLLCTYHQREILGGKHFGYIV